MSKHHYFIALALSIEEKKLLAQYEEQLGIRSLFKKQVHTEDLHLTLAFLGNADYDAVKHLMDAIEQKLQYTEGFPLVLSYFSTFGRKDRPRIFFIAPEREERLEELQAIVAECCRSSGFQIDEKPFNPHITLARQYIGEEDLTSSVLEMYSQVLKSGVKIAADRVCLYETHIDQIPKYKEIKSISLMV